jgi:hypothetical protein
MLADERKEALPLLLLKRCRVENFQEFRERLKGDHKGGIDRCRLTCGAAVGNGYVCGIASLYGPAYARSVGDKERGWENTLLMGAHR